MFPRLPIIGRCAAALGSAAFALAALGATLSTSAQAADKFPDRPLRFIVPFAPGGSGDVIGRAVAEGMAKALGQPVVVDNRGGAGTIVGVNYVAKSPADGYTVLLSGNAATINTASGRTLPYDLQKELTPVSLLFSGAQVVLVAKDSPFKTLPDLVNYAKANPGKLKFGSSGIGSAVHMSLEAFNAAAGIKALHVPYRGMGPALTDLMGGQIDYSIAGTSLALPFMNNGTLRALAINSERRSEFMPETPTAKEQGVNVLTQGWYGLFAPAGTPPAVLAKLNEATRAALKSPDLMERFKTLGGEARPSSQAEAKTFVDEEIQSYTGLIQKLGIKLGD